MEFCEIECEGISKFRFIIMDFFEEIKEDFDLLNCFLGNFFLVWKGFRVVIGNVMRKSD